MQRHFNALEGQKAEMTFDFRNNSVDEKISIVIVHKDRPEYLNAAVQTLAICSANNNYELIVVDNGSSDPRVERFLARLEESGVKVIRNEENLYWSKAANQGVKAASKDSKYLVFLHHDVLIEHPAWLDIMINVALANKSGIVATNLKFYDFGNEQRIAFMDEHCMLVTRECWNDAGPFNEDLPQEGAPFIFSFKSSRMGHNPVSMDPKQMKLVHHYDIRSVDQRKYIRIQEAAQILIPKLVNELQKQ